MEREVGEIFEFDGVKLQVVKDRDDDCGMNNVGCYFLNNKRCILQKCLAYQRKDSIQVKFIRIGD